MEEGKVFILESHYKFYSNLAVKEVLVLIYLLGVMEPKLFFSAICLFDLFYVVLFLSGMP